MPARVLRSTGSGRRPVEDIHTSLTPLATAEANLVRLAEQAHRDLDALAHPAAAWVRPVAGPGGEPVAEVVIVGAGQAGLNVGLALKREGVRKIVLLDRNPSGCEGPWETFARMEVLRTPKTLVGAELNIPSLSVRSWFEARYGTEAWQKITWIPRRDWMAYLRWYRTIAGLDIRNEVEVAGIAPAGDLLAVKTEAAARCDTLLARRVVIATGHDGGGSWSVPEIITAALPPQAYAHSNGPIDFGALVGKRVGVLGHGGSAFDAGLAALHNGAASVDLCFRRALLPVVNPHRWLEFSGFLAHYRELDDRTRWNVGRHFDVEDQPPPRHTFERARAEPRLQVHGDSAWRTVAWTGTKIEVTTDRDRRPQRPVAPTGTDRHRRSDRDLVGPLYAAAGRGAPRACQAPLSRHAFRVPREGSKHRAVSGAYLRLQFFRDGQHGSGLDLDYRAPLRRTAPCARGDPQPLS